MIGKLIKTLLCLTFAMAVFASSPGHAVSGSVTYIYDDLGRLVQISYDNGTIIQIDYDPAGNRTVRVITL